MIGILFPKGAYGFLHGLLFVTFKKDCDVLAPRSKQFHNTREVSWFRNANGADHRTPANRVKDCEWMKYPQSNLVRSKGNEIVNMPLPVKNPENGYNEDAAGDGSPFVIFYFPRLVCKRRGRDIKSCQSTNSTNDKVNQNKRIP